MSQPGGLCRWHDCLASHFSHLSKPQAFVLAVYSFGLALAKRCAVGKPDTVARRLQRFLSNPRTPIGCGG